MIKFRGDWLTEKKLDSLSLPPMEGKKVLSLMKKKSFVFSLKKLLPSGQTEKIRHCKAAALQAALIKNSRQIYIDPNPYRWGGIKVYQSTALLFQEPTLEKEILKIFLRAVDYIFDNMPAILLGVTITLIIWRICV